MRFYQFQFLFLIAIAFVFACNDPVQIGADLLEEDQVNLQFTTDVLVQAKTVTGQPLQTYSPFTALQLSRFLFGQFEDPLLGTTDASIYTQLSLGTQSPPDFNFRTKFDSIILSLAYDTIGGYGNISEPFGLEVYLLEEEMSNITDYFSDQTFLTGSEPVGTIDFVPNLDREIIIKEYVTDSNGDTLTADPHVRVPLTFSEEMIDVLIKDTAIVRSDSALQDFIKGLYIRPKASVKTPGIINFDFTNDISRISFYFRSSMGDLQEYRLDFNSGNTRLSSLTPDYSNALVEPYLDAEQDSLLFVQGMVGPNAQITFPDVSGFKDIVVNKAELELTVADLVGNNTLTYPATEQLVASKVDDEEREILFDVRAAIFGNNPIQTDVFGGNPVMETQDGVTLTKYRINISGYFQGVIEGRENNSFIISAGVENARRYYQLPAKPTTPSKVVFYGTGHPLYAPKLNLTYTRL